MKPILAAVTLAAVAAGGWWWASQPRTPEERMGRACLALWQDHSDVTADGETLLGTEPLTADQVMDRRRTAHHTELMQDPAYAASWDQLRRIVALGPPQAEHTAFVRVRLNGIGRVAACSMIGPADPETAALDTRAMTREVLLNRP